MLGALETGRINVAARAVGNAQRAYDEALKYSRERQAFGEPIFLAMVNRGMAPST